MDNGALGTPVDVRDVLAAERQALLDLLSGLDPVAWTVATVCPAWSVHELAVHIVHDDVRRLSADRDGHVGPWLDASTFDELVTELDRINQEWVTVVAPTMSPRMTRGALGWLATQTEQHLLDLEPRAVQASVAWAGPGPHPNWLDVAREYSERWVHQQQLREAVGRPGLTDERFAGPVCDTFARAIPAVLPPRPDGTGLRVRVYGPFERTWCWVAASSGWRMVGSVNDPSAVIDIPVEAFWKRAVRMWRRDEVEAAAEHHGDATLAAAVLDMRGAIVADGATA